MTFIAAWASQGGVLNVSDRLVSVGGTMFDPQSNKTLVFLGSNALLTFSYTGDAYIEGAPSDHWLAATLGGIEVESPLRPSSLRISSPALRLQIGPQLGRLVQRLNEAARKPGVLAAFEVLGSGWLWPRRGRARPVVVSIERKGRGEPFAVSWSPRHLGRQFCLSVAPQSNVNMSDLQHVRTHIKAAGSRGIPDDIETELVRLVRLAATQLPALIGTDCMSVVMAPPQFRWLRIRYLSDRDASLSMVAKGRDQSFVLPATFLPWIIGPGLVSAPVVIAGKSILSVGNFLIDIDAPSPGVPGLIHASRSVNRPPDPTRRPR